MSLILIIAVVSVGTAALVAVALGRTLRGSSVQDLDEARLARLGAIQSPSGKPFFPNRKAALQLADEIHDVEQGA